MCYKDTKTFWIIVKFFATFFHLFCWNSEIYIESKQGNPNHENQPGQLVTYKAQPHRATPAKHDPTERHPAKPRKPGSPKDEAKARNTDSQKHRQPTEKGGSTFILSCSECAIFLHMLKNPDKQKGRRTTGQPAKPRKMRYFFCRSVLSSFLVIPILPALLRSLLNAQHFEGQRETMAPPPMVDSHLVPCLSSEFFLFSFQTSSVILKFFLEEICGWC